MRRRPAGRRSPTQGRPSCRSSSAFCPGTAPDRGGPGRRPSRPLISAAFGAVALSQAPDDLAPAVLSAAVSSSEQAEPSAARDHRPAQADNQPAETRSALAEWGPAPEAQAEARAPATPQPVAARVEAAELDEASIAQAVIAEFDADPYAPQTLDIASHEGARDFEADEAAAKHAKGAPYFQGLLPTPERASLAVERAPVEDGEPVGEPIVLAAANVEKIKDAVIFLDAAATLTSETILEAVRRLPEEDRPAWAVLEDEPAPVDAPPAGGKTPDKGKDKSKADKPLEQDLDIHAGAELKQTLTLKDGTHDVVVVGNQVVKLRNFSFDEDMLVVDGRVARSEWIDDIRIVDDAIVLVGVNGTEVWLYDSHGLAA